MSDTLEIMHWMTLFLGVALAINPGDHSFTIKVGELKRHYTVHVPSGYDGKTPVPVVVMLHGGGGSGKAAATETGWSAKADREGFLAVFPNAMPPDPSKPSHFARNPQLWNDGSERFYQGQNKVDDVGFFSSIAEPASYLMTHTCDTWDQVERYWQDHNSASVV